MNDRATIIAASKRRDHERIRCEHCDRPMADEVDDEMMAELPGGERPDLCWADVSCGECDSPIDWRARALKAEAELARRGRP